MNTLLPRSINEHTEGVNFPLPALPARRRPGASHFILIDSFSFRRLFSDAFEQRGWGDAILSYLERVAIASSVKHLFVLSSRTMQWFVERGFEEATVADLPKERYCVANC